MKNSNQNSENFFVSFNHGVISANADQCSDCEHSQEMEQITKEEAVELASKYNEDTGLYQYHLSSTATNKGLR